MIEYLNSTCTSRMSMTHLEIIELLLKHMEDGNRLVKQQDFNILFEVVRDNSPKDPFERALYSQKLHNYEIRVRRASGVASPSPLVADYQTRAAIVPRGWFSFESLRW